jgi:hypothetical protein
MVRKLIALSSFFMMLSFASLTYADNCPDYPGYNCFPADFLSNIWQQSQITQA